MDAPAGEPGEGGERLPLLTLWKARAVVRLVRRLGSSDLEAAGGGPRCGVGPGAASALAGGWFSPNPSMHHV